MTRDTVNPNYGSVGFVVPLYRSKNQISSLVDYVNTLTTSVPGDSSLTLVVDGCEESYRELLLHIDRFRCEVTVVVLSRNFGVGPALRAAMSVQKEDFTIAFGSDLQEPLDLFVTFASELRGHKFDLVLGQRRTREDPISTRFFSSIFWWLNRLVVFPEVPKGGFDVFGCNRVYRENLVALSEHRTNITSQMLWLGFRRNFYPFDRLSRSDGKSTWSFKKKARLFADSFAAFSVKPLLLSFSMMIASWLSFIGLSNMEKSTFVVVVLPGALLLGSALLAWPYIARVCSGDRFRPTFVIRVVEKYSPN